MHGDNKIILIVDMLKGFLEKGNLYCGPESRKIIPHIVHLIKSNQWEKIIYICDNHDERDKEFDMFPPHCIKGTKESEIIDELTPFKGVIIPKTRLSGFYNTDLEEQISNIQPDKVVVVGVCTDICVLYTVFELRTRYYNVEVPKGCVATFNIEAHNFALNHMEKMLGAVVV